METETVDEVIEEMIAVANDAILCEYELPDPNDQFLDYASRLKAALKRERGTHGAVPEPKVGGPTP